MKPFLHAHATHPDAHQALALAAAQIAAQAQAQQAETGSTAAPTLGWLYLSDHFSGQAERLLADAAQRWPGVAWVGAVGVGVCASGVEYFDVPALSLMLAELPREQFRVFSGAQPLGEFRAQAAQVHADPATADLGELIADMSRRTTSGYLFGGLASSRTRSLHLADGVLQGGLSGVAFGPAVGLVSRVTQGCQPVGPRRTVTQASHNVVARLDGEPALDCLLRDLELDDTADVRKALPRIRETLVGLSAGADRSVPAGQTAPHLASQPFHTPARQGTFGSDTRVRHIVGLDPARRGVAVGEGVESGMQLAFCARNTEAARRDLMRVCAEIRDEVDPQALSFAQAQALEQRNTGAPTGTDADMPALPGSGTPGIAGAVYVSCTGRGGGHFGAPSAELAMLRRALGDVPLVGFFAAGEIGHHHLYGYTGVLTVFRSD